MISRIPPRASIHRVGLILAIVCLLATFAGVIFVAAHNNNDDLPSTPPDQAAQVKGAQQNAETRTRIVENFAKLPLSFEINKGQMDEPVKFLSHGAGYDLFLTANEAVLRVHKPRPLQTDKLKANADVREGTVLRLRMLGANTTADVEGQEELPGKINYFIGNDQAKWRRNIPTYRKAYFKDVYPGIDVVYYGKQRELEYDFVVAAGANPNLIRFTVEGAERIRLDKGGALQLNLTHGDVSLNKPVIYQLDENGSRREIKGEYVIKGNEVRFKLERFDSSKQLIIDPVLSYSTMLGAGTNDQAFSISVDSQGSAYVTGTTDGTTFPTTPGSFKSTSTRSGAFVTKLDPTGSTLVYSTYLTGINGSTSGLGIAVDSAGNAHVTGSTSATDFPTVNGLKTTSTFYKTTDSAASWNNQNAGLLGDLNVLAIAKNAPNTIYAQTFDGIYRTTDGGANWTKTTATGLTSPGNVSAMAVDPGNASVVYAGTFSGLFKSTDGGNNWSSVSVPPLGFNTPQTIVFDPVTPATIYIGAANGLVKSTDSGASWIAQNNFGIPGVPNVRALAIDPTTPLTVYAGTSSNGVFKSTNGGGVWTAMNTGMGGPSPTFINTIVIDPANPATLYTGHGSSGGINKSTNGATSWSPLTTDVPQGAVNAMVATSSAVYAAVGNAGVIKSTNGGSNWTPANAGLFSSFVRVLAGRPGDAAVLYAGGISSFSTDAFVTKFNAAGSGLLFSTLLGGSNEETGNGIAVDGSGNIYVAGQTTSMNFPAVNAAQPAPAVTDNCFSGFVTKLNPAVPSYAFSTYLRGSQCDTANSVAVDGSGNVYVTGTTSSTDFLSVNAFQPFIAGTFGSDAFVTKLTTGGAVVYSTYLGGSNSGETGWGITADSSGNAYVTGSTSSTNFPTVNPIQTAQGNSGDVFVTKLNPQGSALVFSTYLAGKGSDVGRGIAIDSANNVYVTGFSDSADYPLLPGALRTKSAMYKSIDGAATWSNDNYGFGEASFTTFGGSAVGTLAIHPTETSTIYAGTGSGVFKSTNGGRTWSPMNNGLTSRGVSALVISPTTPSTLYILISDFTSARGVYKSTDGGATWTQRNNGIVGTEFFSLAIDPASPNTLYVGVGFCCQAGSHIYKTTDGADNWAPLPSAPTAVPTTLTIDPLNPLTIYAADAATPGTVHKSTDGGATWQPLGSAVNFARSISASPLTAGLVYAHTDQSLLRSVDGGANWTPTGSPRTGKIVFDPVNASTLYLLTNPFDFNPQGILKSTNNGQTWIPVNKGLNSPRASALAINPVKPSTLYVGSSGSTGSDAFVTKINAAGSSLIYSTFIGGSPSSQFANFNAQAFGIALDSSGNAYITGGTSSQDFAVTPNAYQPFNRGFNDAFITKIGNSYLISGRVLNNGLPGSPLSGAEVVLSDGTSLTSVLTEGDGSYQFSRLREGGNYTVTATLPHFTMTPTSQTFNNLNSDQVLDFSALTSDSPFHTISGQVTENGAGLPGVTVTLSGSQPGIRTTDSNGNYSFELIIGGNYTVTPSAVGFTFAPPSQIFNGLNTNQTANFAATRQSFVVTNANNHGAGSLRDAIVNANASPGTDTITFNIPGPGVKTINLLIALPEITDRVVIDATTQPGYAGTPLIEIDGTALSSGSSGLVIKSGGSTIRGLSIGNFRNDHGIWLNNCDNNVIQSNYIGVAANGTTARNNNRGIKLTNSNNNLIGGTTAAARNLISGNSNGIEIDGSANTVQGNFIGTNAAGTAAVANIGGGVVIFSAPFADNLIGGTAAGAGNLISGNQSFGITTSGNGTKIQGNLIGTNVSGTAKIANGNGVQAIGLNMLVGGTTPAARNVISGNSNQGVFIRGAGSKLQGNYIGTDITGGVALGNLAEGVIAGETALVGGTAPEERNIISANGGFGNVVLGLNSAGNAAIVQGNYIGTDVTGTRALGGTSAGVSIVTGSHVVGGLVPGARNVISGNAIGVQVGLFFSGVVGNVIQGNFIGLNAAGTGPLPNTQQGITIADAVNNTIGGSQSEAGNKIAFNGGPGVSISTGTGNTVRRNSIFSNNGLGIDLGANGVTPNDGNDGDTGANHLQNFPVITGVLSSANSTTIQGTLKSIPNTTFQIDFYSNAAVDPSGNGEGAQFFNTTSVNTDLNGDATINVTFPAGLAAGRVITATATDPNGNTSEFSTGDATSASGSLQFSVSSVTAIEDVGTLTITVLRTGGTAGNLSVDYATANGTAIAGQDYTSTSGTLIFSAGETSKTFQIPILDDATTESEENFTVTLRNTPTLESLGAPSTLVVTLLDHNTTPVITTTTNVIIPEGNTGTTTDVLFTISLSAATGRSVTGNFGTVNIGAFGGSKCDNSQGIDYVSTSGAFSFQPGTTSFAVPVKICGDTSAEANESFRVALSNVSGAAVTINQGFGTILDDDLLFMLLEESGPNPNQAAALDAILAVRDPFSLLLPEWASPGVVQNTRVMLFAQNLQLNPGELPGAVLVRLFASNGQVFQVSAEDVRPLRNSEFTQVIIRLPNNFPAGTTTAFILAHSRQRNSGTF